MSWKKTNKGKSRQERGYGRDWERKRLAALIRDEYLCVPCRSKGIIKPATQVDHIENKAVNGSDDLSNLQSICNDCHSRKTYLESRKSSNIKGACDVNGNPIDKDHPWNNE